MPYIPQERREELFAGDKPKTAGELSFWLSVDLKEYVENHGKSYQTYNDIVGVLENLKLEFVRVIVSSYEDRKETENGGVFD